MCGTTAVEVKNNLARKTKWIVKNPKITGENTEKIGNNS
jgi:hypothetical protein